MPQMNQLCKQLHNKESVTIAEQINDLLSESQNFRLADIFPIPIQKIGGVDYEYLVVFELKDN